MGRRDGLVAGQRWRSHTDGHTVVTVERLEERVFVRFDLSAVTAAIAAADFLEDYEFVEVVETATTFD